MNTIVSSIDVCPINFKKFGSINSIVNNLDASIMFSKLKFHQANSKIIKDGKIWIARSREQLASWFGFSTKKVDSILSELERMGLIEKKVSTWYGKKRLFISASKKIESIPVNMKLLNTLVDVTGSLHSALIFSKIAYSFANTTISHENKKWCCIKKQSLSEWSNLSVRKIDNILENLASKGLILKKNFIYNEKLQSHFHIPDFAIKTLKERFLNIREVNKTNTENIHKENSQNCRNQPAKNGTSIKIRTKQEKTNNKTNGVNVSTTMKSTESDINFEKINNKLSKRQLKYLEGAINKTIERYRLKISNPNELIEQIKFSILNAKQQHSNINRFKHVVSRCMKILSDGNWRTPIGFDNHSEKGNKIKTEQKEKEKEWQRTKEKEQEETHRNSLIMNKFLNNTNDLTEKALSIAKQVVCLANSSDNQSDRKLNLIDDLTNRMYGLIKQGADKDIVVSYLKQNMN